MANKFWSEFLCVSARTLLCHVIIKIFLLETVKALSTSLPRTLHSHGRSPAWQKHWTEYTSSGPQLLTRLTSPWVHNSASHLSSLSRVSCLVWSLWSVRTHRTQTHLWGLRPCQYLVYLTIILRSISDGDPCGRMSPEVTPGPGKTKLEMGLVFLYILTLEAWGYRCQDSGPSLFNIICYYWAGLYKLKHWCSSRVFLQIKTQPSVWLLPGCKLLSMCLHERKVNNELKLTLQQLLG